MAPSPNCEIKNGAAAYVTAVGGVDVTPAATIIIRLISQTDVDSWSITCITTDDSSDAATVTAALTIDSAAKTATFTAPVPGKTYRFRSRVNGGIDRNGVAQSSYSTTFVVCTLLNGRRMTASDETIETDSTFGWSKWMNDVKRSLPSGVASGTWGSFGAGSPAGSDNQFQYKSSSSFAGESGLTRDTNGVIEMNRGLKVIGTAVATLANAQLVAGTAATGFRMIEPFLQGLQVTGVATLASAMVGAGTAATGFNLVRPLINAPMFGGTATYTGTSIVGQATPITASAKVAAHTTNDTVTALLSFALKDEAMTTVTFEGHAQASGGAAGGSYVRRIAFLADGGVATSSPTGSTLNVDDEFRNSGFTGIAVGSGLTIGVSGLSAFVNCKGTPTGRISWAGVVNILESVWG